jgi:hypothetical protein
MTTIHIHTHLDGKHIGTEKHELRTPAEVFEELLNDHARRWPDDYKGFGSNVKPKKAR